MKQRFYFLLSFLMMLTISSWAKDYKYTTVPGDMMKTRIYTLDNGLKVYLSVNNEKPRIQTYIAVRTGSRNDPAETTGLAHYLEHLMFKGTKQFGTTDPAAEKPYLDDITRRYEEYRKLTDPEARRQAYHEIDSVSQLAARYNIPNEYDKLMATIGSEGSNAYTSNDVTCYVEDIPANEVENWAKIQADRFQNMVVRGFHTELEAVYEEYNIGLTSDANKLWEALNAKMFPTHPYGTQTTIGTQEHLKNPSIVNIMNYYHRYYCPNNVAICMAGDFDCDKVVATIDRYFGMWKPNATLSRPEYGPQPELTAPVDTTIIGPEAERVMLGWRFKAAADLQSDTLDVIGDLLSNGKAGLIDLDINQKMLMLGADCGSEHLTDYSQFIMLGVPKEGQTLNEVRQLLLDEIEKLKRGEFADNLLPSVINNMKLREMQGLDINKNRADKFVDAFINGQRWEDVVGRLDRISNMTKQQIVDFANRYFKDNYVCVYKRQGEDKTQKKIDKPSITPIPSNRDYVSQFVKDIQNAKVEPIQPRFVDFSRDMTITKTKKGLPLLYKQNTSNGLFNLLFRYEFGCQADNRYVVAADYADYIGTDKMTAAELKQRFYELACRYNIGVDDDNITISLFGLNEKMPEALALLEDFLKNAKADNDAYGQYVALTQKARQDAKKNQRNCFSALYDYGVYGPYNSTRNQMSIADMKKADPQQLLNLLKNLSRYEHTVLYYGADDQKTLSNMLGKLHKTQKKLVAVPQNKPYIKQEAAKNEVWIAPYEAKNIYMRMYHNENRDWNPDEAAVQALFNEYFGGGMNTIVFQELREARGLAYNASAFYSQPTEKGQKESFITHIIAQNDKMKDCISVFHEILNQMPQSQGAFNIAKESLGKQLASLRTTKSAVFNAWIRAKKLGLDYDLNEKIYKALPAMQLKDIVDFEKANMANKAYRYIILGDEKELDMKTLEKIGPIKRLTIDEIFGE